jgi:hypothetical protein
MSTPELAYFAAHPSFTSTAWGQPMAVLSRDHCYILQLCSIYLNTQAIYRFLERFFVDISILGWLLIL